MLLPAQTPGAMVSRIHDDVVGGIHQREHRERFAAQGLDVIGSSVDEFRGHLRAEVAKWRGVVQTAGLKAK
jgi:tripartite-type tricarboxylate transporter receptor subunit TctC